MNGEYSENGGKTKRKRRKKDEVSRDFICIANGCNKAYGYTKALFTLRSENSRNQHLKIKHRELWDKITQGEIELFDKEGR